MKIIDCWVKGNVIRFPLGADDDMDYWGDDWDDRPYEHNAGRVYERYIKDYAYVYVGYGYSILTPEDDWTYRGNSPFTKEEFKKRKAPCLVIVKDEDSWWDPIYSQAALQDDAIKFYFNDHMEPGTYIFSTGKIEKFEK